MGTQEWACKISQLGLLFSRGATIAGNLGPHFGHVNKQACTVILGAVSMWN